MDQIMNYMVREYILWCPWYNDQWIPEWDQKEMKSECETLYPIAFTSLNFQYKFVIDPPNYVGHQMSTIDTINIKEEYTLSKINFSGRLFWFSHLPNKIFSWYFHNVGSLIKIWIHCSYWNAIKLYLKIESCQTSSH